MIQVRRLAWYRLRAEHRRRWVRYLGVAMLVGLLGGVSMASIAGARRTESSFPVYVASTNPSTVGVFTRYDDPELGVDSGYSPRLAAEVARLPFVARSTTAIIFDGNIDLSSVTGGHPRTIPGEAPPAILGSADGEFTSVDRVSLLSGRLPGPGEIDAAVVNREAALQFGVHVGSVLRFPIYTDAELASPRNFPPRIVSVTIVGEVVYNRDVVESDYEALNSATVLFSPALTRELEFRYARGTETFLQLVGGSRSAKRVLAEVDALDPIASHFPSEVTTSFVPTVQQAITPEAIALGIFGGIAGVSALLIAGLMIGREIRERGGDLDTLRALGADRLMLLGDELGGVLVAVIVGAVVAVGVAVTLSPLMPLGPVRSVYPDPGVAADWTVLAAGLGVLLVVLSATAALAARREVWRHAAGRRDPVPGSRLVRASVSAGLPVSAQSGIRFATQAGRGRGTAPIRSAMLGGVLAVTVLVSAITFGASLDDLVSHPALYGWNWNYALLASFAGAEDLPGPQVTALLDKDDDIAAWSGLNIVKAKLDDQPEGMLVEQPRAAVAPPILSGHGLDAANEIVLGPTTLASLHKRLGDTVTLDNSLTAPTTLVIVGTMSMPALQSDNGTGAGALVATSDFPSSLLNLQDATVPGPNAILVRLRAGIPSGAGLRSLQAINADVNRLAVSSGLGGGVVGVLRPVTIVNFRSMGTTPSILAAGLALGAVVALGLTLSSSVRRRRRELALLKALGFTRRQLAASIAWQSTFAAVVGIVLGIPLGVAIGRQLWLAFARSISVVPEAAVPVAVLVAVGVGALAFANLVAIPSGRDAARTPTAIVLRSE